MFRSFRNGMSTGFNRDHCHKWGWNGETSLTIKTHESHSFVKFACQSCGHFVDNDIKMFSLHPTLQVSPKQAVKKRNFRLITSSIFNHNNCQNFPPKAPKNLGQIDILDKPPKKWKLSSRKSYLFQYFLVRPNFPKQKCWVPESRPRVCKNVGKN